MPKKSKREELLRATWAVIAERGVHRTRVEDVANAVGVANSLVYYHFESRAGLLAATMDYNDQSATSSAKLPASADSYSRVEATLLGDLGASRQVHNNNIVWSELNAAAVFDDDLRERVSRTTRSWIATIADEIRAGQRDGSIRPDIDVDDEAEMLTALLDGLTTRYLAGSITRQRGREIVKATIKDRLAT